VVLRVSAGALVGWLVAADQSNASDYPTQVTSITFGRRTIDRTHAMRWHDWTISFGTGRPIGTFNAQGATLHGLRCANSKGTTIKCRLFMSMKPVESFPHFCEI
jgi:hypothetical protein